MMSRLVYVMQSCATKKIIIQCFLSCYNYDKVIKAITECRLYKILTSVVVLIS